jgi:SAM-dependent methyltransferase
MTAESERIAQYWGREHLAEAILAALTTRGVSFDALTVDALAPVDQFHGGGKPVTGRLARLAAIRPGTRVLDVGGGFGGPARTLAVEFGCHVTTIDLTDSYVRAAKALTARMGLDDRVTHQVGDAVALPFPDGAFDLLWTQNSGMNTADKERLYAGFHRVLRPGGLLALQEPMAGPEQPVVYPLMWARDPSTSFLRTPEAMRTVIEGGHDRRDLRTRHRGGGARPQHPAPGDGRRDRRDHRGGPPQPLRGPDRVDTGGLRAPVTALDNARPPG